MIYNLGNGRGFTVREVIESADASRAGRSSRRKAPRSPGDPAVLVASSAKIRSELGWTPQRSGLDDIVASAWQWMQHTRSRNERSA